MVRISSGRIVACCKADEVVDDSTHQINEKLSICIGDRRCGIRPPTPGTGRADSRTVVNFKSAHNLRAERPPRGNVLRYILCTY